MNRGEGRKEGKEGEEWKEVSKSQLGCPDRSSTGCLPSYMVETHQVIFNRIASTIADVTSGVP